MEFNRGLEKMARDVKNLRLTIKRSHACAAYILRYSYTYVVKTKKTF
jgi:hypothetical protein